MFSLIVLKNNFFAYFAFSGITDIIDSLDGSPDIRYRFIICIVFRVFVRCITKLLLSAEDFIATFAIDVKHLSVA